VASGFWGSSAGFNGTHFGGPEAIGAALMINQARESRWLITARFGSDDSDDEVIVINTTAFASRDDAIRYYEREYGPVTEKFGRFIAVGSSGTSRPGRGFGWGVTGSGHAFAGIGLAGGGGTAGVFGGQFTNGQRTVNGAGAQGGGMVYALAGANAVTPRAIVSAPEISEDESATVLGASAGVGAGLFFTNAASPEELRGPFDTRQLNTPWFGVQYDTSGDVKVFSFTVGPQVGASYYHGKTSAVTTPSLPGIPMGGTIVR
jgi:hypothetical protein